MFGRPPEGGRLGLRVSYTRGTVARRLAGGLLLSLRTLPKLVQLRGAQVVCRTALGTRSLLNTGPAPAELPVGRGEGLLSVNPLFARDVYQRKEKVTELCRGRVGARLLGLKLCALLGDLIPDVRRGLPLEARLGRALRDLLDRKSVV